MSERMTAKEAAARAKESREIKPATVEAVVRAWLDEIKRQCDMGKTRIKTERLPVLRMPVTHREFEAARDVLRDLGYTIWASEIIWEEVT